MFKKRKITEKDWDIISEISILEEIEEDGNRRKRKVKFLKTLANRKDVDLLIGEVALNPIAFLLKQKDKKRLFTLEGCSRVSRSIFHF